MSEGVCVPIAMNLTWRYASGEAMERFCKGLRERRIEALRCASCGRRYLPPRPFCGNCHLRLSEWVPVGDEGTLEAWTVVHVPILDGRTGRMRPTPFGTGLIRLDGSDTTINHFLTETDPGRVRIGSRVRSVWRNELEGAMDDIMHFEVLE
ncbi:MAG: Zn-ribbon domain-containing OB-fold protein [Thermoanaerobaculia bacterium]